MYSCAFQYGLSQPAFSATELCVLTQRTFFLNDYKEEGNIGMCTGGGKSGGRWVDIKT